MKQDIHDIPVVTNAIPKENFFLEILFQDGETKTLDMKPFIKNGISSALKDEAYFKQVMVMDGFIYWENGFDFCPEFLKNYT